MSDCSSNLDQIEQNVNEHVDHTHRQSNRILSFLIKTIDYLKLFLETSTIHGINHLVALRRHPFEILLWFTTVLLSVIGVLNLSYTTWARYQSSPTVVSMDRDMYAWNTTFPSVTVCLQIKSDMEKVRSYVKTSPEPNKKLLEYFIVALSNATFGNFKDIPDYDGIPPDMYMGLIVNLSSNFQPLVTMGVSRMSLKIVPTITEMGLCYSVNSNTAIYNSPEYRDAKRWDKLKNQKSISIHPLDGEVMAQVLNINAAYKVYIHGPKEFPDISSRAENCGVRYYLKIIVNAFTIYTAPAVAKLNIGQRGCRFPHENNLSHNAVYSYSMCRMECRIQLCLEYCNCIPHFYRNIGDEKICDVKGLQCLTKYHDELYKFIDKDGKKMNCQCYPLCNDVNYVLLSNSLKKWNFSTNLQWGMVVYPKTRFRRDVIYGFTDVLVSLGSMSGLFLGCSVLSFIEIVFFLTIGLISYSRRLAMN